MKISIAAYGSVLLVFAALPDGEDILARATQVTRQVVVVRMREQASPGQPFDLSRELRTQRFGSGTGPVADRPRKMARLRVLHQRRLGGRDTRPSRRPQATVPALAYTSAALGWERRAGSPGTEGAAIDLYWFAGSPPMVTPTEVACSVAVEAEPV